MPLPDFAAALSVMPTSSAADILPVLGHAASPLGTDIHLYLLDFEGLVLQPVLVGPELDDLSVPDLPVSGTPAGEAFRTGRPIAEPGTGGVRVWVPIVERSEPTGVMAITVPQADPTTLDACAALGLFAGLLIQSTSRSSDVLHLSRRRRPMTLGASMQWDMLPPLLIDSPRGMACGALEPAYEIAGDVFDYAINGNELHAVLFDGMGHGVESTLMTVLATGAYRHARRQGEGPAEMYASVDEALRRHYGGEGFATGAVVRLQLDSGILDWVNGGHPRPLLLRNRRVVRQLECSPSLPFGLGGACREEATEQLEPGDSILFFTDGVTEGRPVGGDEFGLDRLVEVVESDPEMSDPEPGGEFLHRLRKAVVEYQSGKLRDDATLLFLHWEGPGAS
jgi:serine phosphatase RsbU (regulator of sigma subunit)